MKLGQIIKKWRVMMDRDLRSVAREIGTSAATLLRLEHGHDIDAKTFIKILIWMSKPDSP